MLPSQFLSTVYAWAVFNHILFDVQYCDDFVTFSSIIFVTVCCSDIVHN